MKNKEKTNVKHKGPRDAKGKGWEKPKGPRPERKTDREDAQDEFLLIGRNPVMEAINHDKTIDKIFIKKGDIDGSLRVIAAKAREKGIMVQEVAKEKLDFMSGELNHQGVVAIRPAHEYAEVSDMLALAQKKGEDPFLIILDGITDPHNLGAIMRSADAAGAHGIILPKRRSATLSGIVSKTSAGAIEHVLVARETNLSKVLDDLKEEGLWIASGQTHGKPYFNEKLTGPIALVIGSEGEGVSKLITKKSDFAVKIPMYGEITSLNASVAAGLLMYEVVRQRKFS